jgi:hypothetical protein
MKGVFCVVRAMPIAWQRVTKHNHTTTNTSVAMQHAVDTRIEEDVFSMCPPLGYISGTEPNQGVIEREREREWNASLTVKGSAEDWLWVVVIDCD